VQAVAMAQSGVSAQARAEVSSCSLPPNLSCPEAAGTTAAEYYNPKREAVGFYAPATIEDLKRLIQRATPRVEDVRSVDRCDMVRRDHGHLNFRDIVNSADALEFSIDSFIRCMQELDKTSEAKEGEPSATAVHGLLRSLEGLRLLTPAAALPKPTSEVEACEPAAEASEGWQEKAAEAKTAGGECFKNKDYTNALTHYTASIKATPVKDESLSALFSNRSAVLLQLGHLAAALLDAQRCADSKPDWPKGHFRRGCAFRALERLEEAAAAFRDGQALEPTNKDWEREIDKSERQHRALPSTQARQLVWHLLPEILQAWVRAGGNGGVLQAQVNGELADLGTPKWQRIRDKQDAAKAQIRFAFVEEKAYMDNLAANLVKPPTEGGTGLVDLNGQALKIAEVRPFIAAGDSASTSAAFQIDVKVDGKMVAIIGRLPADEDIRRFVPKIKDPPPPKGSVEGALQVQARNGFPKALPRFLGFQSYPGGDLNYPVIDLERDCPGATCVEKGA